MIMFENLTPEQIGWYITGFVDGEGSFGAHTAIRITSKGKVRVVFNCRFLIQLRYDDEEILKEIHKYFQGNGSTGWYSYRRSKAVQGKFDSACVILMYDGLENCMAVKKHFEKFPNLAKKRKDFEIWSKFYEALYKLQELRDYGRFENYSLNAIEKRLEISRLCDELRLVRIPSDVRSLGMEACLQRAGGSPTLYTQRVLESLLEYEVIDLNTYKILSDKYLLKI